MTRALFTLFASGLALAGCSGAMQDSGDGKIDSGKTGSTNETVSGTMPATVNPPADAQPGPDNDQGPDTSVADSTCGADRIGEFVSKTATPGVRADLTSKVGHEKIRWLTPDSVITMDIQEDRLNVMLDDNGVIIGAKCQ
ncbi:I78 family peptidase inhibitor [Qipengyuania qiaonensis]|uniref:Peptidase inhibitor I78 n=1 Tax=Qipengyuania qiaonensis TaxID=2867240 RepID=A0ABS7J457_9SPHN|nr:I78 family peptidase inhibitor [Qipengyuania qiaonensis]MBX7482125.1 hypothetical protein [Qipengyuania qiaonensis]